MLFKDRPSDDFTVIPLQASVEFALHGREEDDGTQRIAGQAFKVDGMIGDCAFVLDPNKQKLQSSEDDDEDEEDDDDDDDEPKKTRISSIAKLMCSQKKLINDKI